MIFILVGPDMAGKTTLGKSLANKFGKLLEYRKFSHYDTQEESAAAAESVVTSLLKAAAFDWSKQPQNEVQIEPTFLFDRFHFPDDLVYGPATSRYAIKDDIMRTYVREVAPALVRLQTAYIYCSASLEVLEQRFKDRGDDYIVPKHLPDIMRRYESWFLSPSFINFPVLRLDSGSLSPQEMVAVAADFIRYQSVKFKESAK